MATMKKSDTYGPASGEHWQQILADLATDLANLAADVAALKTAVNTHTHTENTAASYTQNATSGAANANTMGTLASATIKTTYNANA